MSIKEGRIFAPTGDTLRYISEAIYDGLYKDDEATTVNYTYWGMAFSTAYDELHLKHPEVKRKRSAVSNILNLTIASSNVPASIFFGNLFRRIIKLEEAGVIKSADEFIGTMTAWMLDPMRSFYGQKQREDALANVNFALNRVNRVIRYSDAQKRYVFEERPEMTLTNADTIYLYSEKVFITDDQLYWRKNESSPAEIVKMKPSAIALLKQLIGFGKANSKRWLTKANFGADGVGEIRTISNSLTAIRNVSKKIGMDLIEESGKDAGGKKYRIHPLSLQ